MLDSYRDLIDELLGTPSTVRALAEAPGADPTPEAVALIAGLRDRDLAVTERLQRILKERDPHLPPIGDAASPAAGAVADVVAGMDHARGELVSLLMNLTLKDWERTATHDLDGEITLADEVERHVEFDEDRLARIRRALAAVGR